MDFKSFIRSLSENEIKNFATEAGTTPSYITTHLIYGRKIPQPSLMDGLVRALHKFQSGISRQDLLNFFYPPTDPGEVERRRSPGRRATDIQSGRRTRKAAQ